MSQERACVECLATFQAGHGRPSTDQAGAVLASAWRTRCDPCHDAYVERLVALRRAEGLVAVARLIHLPVDAGR